jgi:excisionase family DNA binding protein
MELTTKQVAEQLKLSPTTVRRLCSQGTLPAKNVASKEGKYHFWRVNSTEFKKWKAEMNGNLPKSRQAHHRVSTTDPVVDTAPKAVGVMTLLKSIDERLRRLEEMWR